MDVEITVLERLILGRLHKRINEITKGETPNVKMFRLMVQSCNFFSYPVIFGDLDPELVKDCITSLRDKGMIQEFEFNGLPSFIPISETHIVVHSHRKATQSDI